MISKASTPLSRFLATVFVVLTAAVLLGSRPTASTAAAITLRVGGAGGFKLPDKNATSPQDRANRAIVEAFENLHPDIRLQSSQGLQLQGPAAESNLLLQFAGGTGPDE